MMRLFGAMALGCLLTGATARPAAAETKTGEVKFTGVNREAARVTAGDKLKLEAGFQQIDVGGVSAVSVHGMVKNTTRMKLHYSYNVAFLDKDKNLIGCQNFAHDVEAGKQSGAGTFIFLPREEIAKIQYYSIAFHESANPIGK